MTQQVFGINLPNYSISNHRITGSEDYNTLYFYSYIKMSIRKIFLFNIIIKIFGDQIN